MVRHERRPGACPGAHLVARLPFAGAAVDSAQSAVELAAKEAELEALERGGAGREEVESARLEASRVREE